MRNLVNPGDDPRVTRGVKGCHVVPRDDFAEKQHRGLAVLVALSAAQLLDPDRAGTNVLNVLWAT